MKSPSNNSLGGDRSPTALWSFAQLGLSTLPFFMQKSDKKKELLFDEYTLSCKKRWNFLYRSFTVKGWAIFSIILRALVLLVWVYSGWVGVIEVGREHDRRKDQRFKFADKQWPDLVAVAILWDFRF
jgi:hypothetical protein